jgi:alpha-tubulin suppressor-like RCC1 family protein
MFHSRRTPCASRSWAMKALVMLVVANLAAAATARLESIAITPAAATISVGQMQAFTAKGTFSDGSARALGPAMSDISPGYQSTCALLTSGGVECWGRNAEGELGNGNTTNSTRAVPVVGITTATAVSLSDYHACALLASGAVRCWGRNVNGQLGNGTVNDATTPVAVSGISTATAVGTGYAYSCALLASGAVRCWGWNYEGALGNGTNTSSSVPVAVTGISTATALAVGESHACALLASGAVKCWGNNAYGGLGNGTTTGSNTPVTVSGLVAGSVRAIVAGDLESCALLTDGTVRCWGINQQGTLGDGTNTDSSVPVRVSGIGTAVAITAGEIHNCAVLSGGPVKCWGYNFYGELGNGTKTDSNTPVRVNGVTLTGPAKLEAGLFHTCALSASGKLQCWGWNIAGQLGNLRRATSTLPVSVAGTPGVVWTSSDSAKATITDRGVATGRAVGNSTITAGTAGLINDNTVLTVK